MDTSKNRSFKSRKITSIALLGTLILLPVTGLLIEVTKGTESEFLHHFSTVFHELTGIVFIVFGIFHVARNWRAMKAYLKK